MIFNVPAYLNNDVSVKEIKDYNKYMSKGVLFDEEILYLFIVGKFVNDQKEKEKYLITEKFKFNLKDFEYLVQFLNGIKKDFFITPHIFTKFVHLVWEKINNDKDYENIMNIFNDSTFIKEQHLEKEYFLKEDNFKKKKWDLINSSLILTSKNYKYNTILTYKWKTNNLCDKEDCLVIHYENIKSAFITNYYN